MSSIDGARSDGCASVAKASASSDVEVSAHLSAEHPSAER